MDWPVSYSECGPCTALDTMSDDGRQVFEAMAGEYLWHWTGRVLGLESVNVRPCRDDCLWNSRSSFWGMTQNRFTAGVGGSGFTPALIGGSWFNLYCGTCGDKCSCGSWIRSLRLPGPVDSIEAVTIDGEPLDPVAYRVDNRALLVRMDGHRWPTCQNMNVPAGEDGTWSVDYTRGTPVPLGGQVAAGVLACELAKAACHDSTCQLPQRVQTVTRQGVTIAVLDAFNDVEKGRTGIWLIDSWLASIMHSPRPARVYSVDVARPHNRTQTWPSSSPSLGGGLTVSGET
jgi:hypothetical protein